MELVGWAGAILFALCGLPQAIQSYKDGHSEGLSHGFLWMWFGGEVLTLIYVWPTAMWPLLFNYGVNLSCLLVILRYKYFKR